MKDFVTAVLLIKKCEIKKTKKHYLKSAGPSLAGPISERVVKPVAL
jgi:hypothetical protein